MNERNLRKREEEFAEKQKKKAWTQTETRHKKSQLSLTCIF
jgi:hypothetical protein